MTPEERKLVTDLFDRLADLERERRDPDAERLMREGQQRAPNAVYALVQTVLLQDEALRAANAHIAELESRGSQSQGAGQSGGGSFLGDRRGKWNTGAVLQGSVPEVRPTDRPMGAPPGYGEDRGYGSGSRDSQGGGGYGAGSAGGYGGAREPAAGFGGPGAGGGFGGPGGPGGGYGGPGAGGPGGSPGGMGSFLGTAAAVAAGAIGGGLLMGGIRSALGGQGGRGPFAGAIDQLGGRPGGGSLAGSELSKDAGLGDIGRANARPGQAAFGNQENKKEEDEEEEDEDDENEEDEEEDEDEDDEGDDDDGGDEE